MLKLKLQYFGHLMQTHDSLEKGLMLGKITGKRRGCQRVRYIDDITDAMDMNLGKLRRWLGTETSCAAITGLQSHRTERLNNNNGPGHYSIKEVVHKLLAWGWDGGRGWGYEASVQNWEFLSSSGEACKSRGGCSVHFPSGL